MTEPKIAIIGAGMAGLACGTALASHGLQPHLFDKGRGPGGRMATRRAGNDGEQLRFDHGAQYFTDSDPAFTATIGKWLARGVVAPWPAAGSNAYVGVPGMNAPLKFMASELDVDWATRITSLNAQQNAWQVEFEDRTETFSHCLIALPAEQAADILVGAAPQFSAQAAASVSEPCWAVMVSFAQPLPIEQDAIADRQGKISWAARNSAKPGRGTGECWVLHASPDHSRAILELDADHAAKQLLQEFFEQQGIEPQPAEFLTAHRWRYAKAQRPAGDGPLALWDADARIGAAGDWLVNPKVEGAWRSGRALAEMVIASL
ncbi:NAD(P)/FAD-dependent oxidoreductase [Pontixanthobacter luteolus]|nr:NAD(P)-binding protein [Pontixanthobacter luteolus]